MADKDKQKARMRLFFQQNRDRYAYYGIQSRDRLKAEMVEAYGGKCVWCDEKNPIKLVLDHIDDDSFVEKEQFGENARGGHKHYGRLKAEGWPKERFQLLCFNCNAEKEHYRKRREVEERWGSKEEIASRPKRAGEGLRENNKSGFKGVFWNTQKERWTARITVNGVVTSLGFYLSIADAARAYKTEALKRWGESANVPTEEEIDRIAAAVINPQPNYKATEEMKDFF